MYSEWLSATNETIQNLIVDGTTFNSVINVKINKIEQKQMDDLSLHHVKTEDEAVSFEFVSQRIDVPRHKTLVNNNDDAVHSTNFNKVEKKDVISLHCIKTENDILTECDTQTKLNDTVDESLGSVSKMCQICKNFKHYFKCDRVLKQICDDCYNVTSPSAIDDIKNCDICLNKFENHNDFIKHDCNLSDNCNKISVNNNVTESNINNDRKFKCEYCGKTFKRRNHLTQHINIHMNERKYVCNVCQKGFNCRSSWNRHLNIHTHEKSYTCNFCQKSFNIRNSWKRHLNLHTYEKKYVCNVCNKMFYDISSLRQHSNIHANKRKYECDICKKSFNTSNILHSHRKLHTNEKLHVCNICLKSFKYKNNLLEHIDFHMNEKRFVCSICQKSFNKKGHLTRHIKNVCNEKKI
ncbi:uncharacterized protein LOC142333854 isoform X1 [Lycorma delicatula]|uniref:uncharacterized protein LOC142333854 isoform X1 n=2 Tax=Lycorma delicatula TaxID=130591 RepID=UPI003F51401E